MYFFLFLHLGCEPPGCSQLLTTGWFGDGSWTAQRNHGVTASGLQPAKWNRVCWHPLDTARSCFRVVLPTPITSWFFSPLWAGGGSGGWWPTKAAVPEWGDPRLSVRQAGQKPDQSESFVMSFFGVDLGKQTRLGLPPFFSLSRYQYSHQQIYFADSYRSTLFSQYDCSNTQRCLELKLVI